MALPQFTMRELVEAGVHFGHKTRRWNPLMAPYLFGVRNDIHIIDLQQTVPLLHRALKAVREVTARNGRVLFVGTKRQASEAIAENASRCGQYYVNHRWLGGMLTNWRTVSQSIKTLKHLEEQLSEEDSHQMGLTKKEILQLTRQREKLEKSLGGIKDMGGLPDILFVIDTLKEDIAIQEAQKLGIPVVAVLDSNSDPNGITYPIPGNDDSNKSIRMLCRLVSDAVLDGIQESVAKSGVDITAKGDVKQDAKLAKAKAKTRGAEASAEEGDDPAKPARGAKNAGEKKADATVEVKKKSPKIKKEEAETATDNAESRSGDADKGNSEAQAS